MLIKTTLLLLIALLFVPELKSFAQDTSYFKNNGEEVKTLQAADYYSILLRDPADTNKVTVKSYFKSGMIMSDKYYPDYYKKKSKFINGKFKIYYENGQNAPGSCL